MLFTYKKHKQHTQTQHVNERKIKLLDVAFRLYRPSKIDHGHK